MVKRIKRQDIVWQKIFSNYISDNKVVFRIYIKQKQ